MVTTVRKEIEFEEELAAALDERSRATGVPVDQIVSNAVRHGLFGDDDEPYYRDGVLLIRRPGTGRPITAEEVAALTDELL